MHDLVSDFYVKLWRSLSRFDHSIGSFQGFVWTMFRNLLKDYFKKSKSVAFSDFGGDDFSLEETLQSDDNVTDLFQRDFTYEVIVSSLDALDVLSREAIYLKYVKQLPMSEMVQMLGVGPDVVRKRLSRAIAKLRDLLAF